jgi:hypothetical protein
VDRAQDSGLGIVRDLAGVGLEALFDGVQATVQHFAQRGKDPDLEVGDVLPCGWRLLAHAVDSSLAHPVGPCCNHKLPITSIM